MAKETISTRAYEAAVAKTLTGFGIEDLTGTSNALFLGRFKPAKVYWRTGASTTPSERESRITGRKYKSVYAPGDEGYSVPIGKGSGGTNLLARQAAVKGILTPSTGIVPSISFSPEVFTG
jgi:hypothetical protein